MKKHILLALICFLTASAFSQKQGNIWYFGEHSGLDFSTGTPTPLLGGQTGTDFAPNHYGQEGTSTISDSTGSLLFYTGGKTVWNRFHSPMLHGTGLMGGTSSTQSSLIVPLPGSSELFYVFTTDDFQDFISGSESGLRYSVVDMCLDTNRGDVDSTQKNILLLDTVTEKLAAVLDKTGSGYWIASHKLFSDAFYAWHLGPKGITDTVVSHIGTINGTSIVSGDNSPRGQGQMKFSPLGTKIATVISNQNPAILEICDFDPASGVVSHLNQIILTQQNSVNYSYGVEFSPDGTKVYVSVIDGMPEGGIYEFDLEAGNGNPDSVRASKTTILPPPASYNFGMQLGPDGKIYVATINSTMLVINSPNKMGAAAGFDPTELPLNGASVTTFPSFIAGYKYHNGLSDCSIQTGEKTISETTLSIFPNPASALLNIENIPNEAKELEIISAIGEILAKKMLSSKNSEQIDISNLPSGLYILKIDNHISKFVKN